MREHLNFSTDEAAAKKWFEKIKTAHTVDCIFKPGTGRLPQREFGLRRFEPRTFVIMSRKLIYLRWQEIMVSLMKTYKGMNSYPKIEGSSLQALRERFYPADFEALISCLNKLASFIGYEIADKESIAKVSQLALCGWRFIQADHSYFECPSCLR
jgi:hypothetical protein